MSHPMWVRGLKLLILALVRILVLSHPMWVRGLKPSQLEKDDYPFCRTLCGCVD